MGWLTDWRRKRVLSRHRMDDALWKLATRGLKFLPASEKLKSLVLLFLAEKEFSGAHGMQVTDAMRVSIAAQACLPILELGLDWYSGWTGIVVYPGDFRVRRSELDEHGVMHEYKLDMLNGEANGMPPLHAGMDRRAWKAAFDDAYQGFCDAVERSRDTWLDPYAAEHPAEFFAVISEAFFEAPRETQRRYPAVYDQLRLFYRQDPAT